MHRDIQFDAEDSLRQTTLVQHLWRANVIHQFSTELDRFRLNTATALSHGPHSSYASQLFDAAFLCGRAQPVNSFLYRGNEMWRVHTSMHGVNSWNAVFELSQSPIRSRQMKISI